MNLLRNLRPDDDPMATRGIPVFKPSWYEFCDFEKYMEAIQPWGMRSGIVKIQPPKEWSVLTLFYDYNSSFYFILPFHNLPLPVVFNFMVIQLSVTTP